MTKRFLLRLCKLIALLLPIFCLIVFSGPYLISHSNYNAQRIWDFYKEPADSLDVVCLGASDVFTGFSPVQAYAQTGLTSYLYCMDGNPGSLYLAQLKEILSRQHPQLLLVEINGFLAGDGYQTEEHKLRLFTENIPPSLNTLHTILRYDCANKLSCLFPFFNYHDQWTMSPQKHLQHYQTLLHQDRSPSLLKGILIKSDLYPIHSAYSVAEDESTLPLAPDCQQYLLEFLDYLSDSSLKNVVFMSFPHVISSERTYQRFAISNEIGRIVQEHGYPYLSLTKMQEEIGLDPVYDYYNADHLNVSGQMKLTEYLADWISFDMNITPMPQTEENALRWDNCIPYMEAAQQIVLEEWENGSSFGMHESQESIAQLEEVIRSWYDGD